MGTISYPISDREVDIVTNPDWEHKRKVHDWRNYATEDLRDIWHSLGVTNAVIIFRMLQGIADNEVWD